MKPKYPFVHVKLLDLLNEPYRSSYYPTLLKRCSVAARNAQFVPWHQIIKFNVKAIALNDFYAAFVLAIEWWNVDDWWTESRSFDALGVNGKAQYYTEDHDSGQSIKRDPGAS